MTYPELRNLSGNIQDNVLTNRLYEALKEIEILDHEIISANLHDRLIAVTDTYHNMLKYSFEFAPDPQRNQIYNNLQISILELADDYISEIGSAKHLLNYSKYLIFKKELKDFADSEINTFVPKLIAIENTESLAKNDIEENLSSQLFYTFFLTDIFKDPEKKLFNLILNEKEISWKLKSVMISAVTLSLIRHFDREKFFLLFDYTSHQEPEIRQRAIIGMFLSILTFQKRMVIYKDILKRLEAIPDNHLLQQRLLAIFIQYIRARETEKITKKIQDEIVPEVLKIRNELEEKLKLDEILSKENMGEKNPEWENFFKDSPKVYQKLEQFSKMQIEGSDVFIGAFAMLKHFDFFHHLINWFSPFDGNNIKELVSQIKDDIDTTSFIEGLENSPVLCNSDKYSFCLNIQHMPVQQRKMMLDLFKSEMNAMIEMQQDEEKIQTELKSKVVNTQYMQDLYRFFKLYPFRKEFSDVFEEPTDMLQSEVLKILFGNKMNIKEVAEYYFANDQYSEAYKLYDWMNQQEETFEMLEKMGFCLQNSEDYNGAIELYKKAEIYNANKIWLQKKLGYCYRKTGNIDEAIDQYLSVIKVETEDFGNLAYLGHLYIEKGDFDNALKYYYKVEYLDPGNFKICRPIGWCSFVLGKYDVAIRYFQKVIDSKPTKNDYLNIGHCFWLKGNNNQSLTAYRQSVSSSGYDINWFRESFLKDKKYLIDKGLDDFEINLMIDYVLIDN
jgi:tetratricopeptide (TPR) repeat protein